MTKSGPSNPTTSSKRKEEGKTREDKIQPRNATNLLRYHRPKHLPLNSSPIPKVSAQSKRLLASLSSYRIPSSSLRGFPYPRCRSAAVLVALFVGRHGDLYVLLSRRSEGLRTYAGDTALPGGKMEEGDESWEACARREAFEEIGLPTDKTKVPLLCVLEPFLASNSTIVTPVVVLILDNTLQPILNRTEVASLFSHPLSSFLSSTPPYPHEPESVTVPYHTYVDLAWPQSFGGGRPSRGGGGVRTRMGEGWVRDVKEWNVADEEDGGRGKRKVEREMMDAELRLLKSSSSQPPARHRRRAATRLLNEKDREGRGFVRMHRFLTGREAGGVKPVFGLTALILIRVASIAHGHGPSFSLHPDPVSKEDHYTFSPSMEQRIAFSLISNPSWKDGYLKEGWVLSGEESGVDEEGDESRAHEELGSGKASGRRNGNVVDWALVRRVADWEREDGYGVVDGRRLSRRSGRNVRWKSRL